jgi:uncharacterized protein GlcG (DUF336 family)
MTTDTNYYNKASITATCAQQMITAATQKAEELGLTMVIAILDESAQLKAFHRMDGAALVGITMAQNKAYASATFPWGKSTQDIFNHIEQYGPTMATFPNMPGYSLIPGGFPIKIDGRQIGSIGVSGGNAEQDTQVAEAAFAVINNQ